jgi:hypothetical protein
MRLLEALQRLACTPESTEAMRLEREERELRARYRASDARYAAQAEARAAYDKALVANGVLLPEEVAEARWCAPPRDPHERRAAAAGITRQEVKTINFGQPVGMPSARLIDGLHPNECLRRYTLMQREDPEYRKVVDRGDQWMTRLQVIAAKALWGHDVSAKVRASDAEKVARERAQISVDDDRWEP